MTSIASRGPGPAGINWGRGRGIGGLRGQFQQPQMMPQQMLRFRGMMQFLLQFILKHKQIMEQMQVVILLFYIPLEE